MRRHRYLRGGYRSGHIKKSRKKLIIRIAFVIVCALVLTVFSVLLGSHLKKKAEYSINLSTDTQVTEGTTESVGELFADGIPVKDPDAGSRELCAADIDVTSADKDALCDLIDSLPHEYNAISVRVSAENGKLVYLSPAVMEYAGLDPSLLDAYSIAETEDAKGFDVYENLRAVLAKAKANGLRCVAALSADSSSLLLDTDQFSKGRLDSIVAGELTSLGCDEILVDGLFTEEGQMPHDILSAVISYLASLRAHTGEALLGLSFPDSLYLTPQNASVVKTLSEYADFLAISVSTDATDPDEAYSVVYDNYYSLKGYFSMYSLRAVITGTDEKVASAVRASLSALSAKSFHFTSYIDDIGYDGGKDEPATDTDTSNGAANSNANRKEDYEQTEEPSV